MKKKPTTKNPSPPSDVERYTVGKAFTKKQRYRLHITATPPSPEARAMIGPPPGLNPFDWKIAGAEASARRILEQAGLPSDPGGYYTIPEGEKVPFPHTAEEAKAILLRSSARKAGMLMDLVKARGKREREDQEWYAAEILFLACIVRANAGKGEPWTMLSLAAELGELVGEGKALGYFAAQGGNKKPPRRIIELERYIRARRRDPDLTASALWDEFTTYHDGELRLADNGAFLTFGWKTMTRAGKKFRKRALFVDGVKGTKARSITERTFFDYWDKNPPTPTK